MTRPGLIALGAVIGLILVTIFLLSTGGGDGDASATDDLRDVKVGKGPKKPKNLSLADIGQVQTFRDGDHVVFEVEMVADIPTELPDESLSWRWELYEAGRMTWIVSANVDLGPNVSVVATQTDYSSSTINDTLPGSIEVDGTRLTVNFAADEVKGFPDDFEWLLKTSLDASRIEASSALAEDRAPENGYLRLSS